MIEPPSLADKGMLWWLRNGALVVLLGSCLGVLGFYLRSFDRVGRDPPRHLSFLGMSPPEGYSPAAAHHIYHRKTSGHDALIATLLNLSINGRMTMDRKDK